MRKNGKIIISRSRNTLYNDEKMLHQRTKMVNGTGDEGAFISSKHPFENEDYQT